jgi:WD40 repeat protein
LPCFSLLFRKNGRVIDSIKLWDVDKRKVSATIRGGSAIDDVGTFSVAYSPNGKTVASTGSKRLIGPRDNVEDEAILRLWEWIPPKKADK